MLWIVISLLIVAIDQVSKYFVVQNIETNQMIPVIDKFFYLTLHRNSGGAWGVMQNSRMIFLIVIPVISVIVIYYLMKSDSKFLKVALTLVLGGAIGNYIDRLLIGKVTDYLLFYFGSYAFPIFNAADIAVTCGTFLLAVYMIFIYKEPQKEKKLSEIPVGTGASGISDKPAENADGEMTVSAENDAAGSMKGSEEKDLAGNNTGNNTGNKTEDFGNNAE